MSQDIEKIINILNVDALRWRNFKDTNSYALTDIQRFKKKNISKEDIDNFKNELSKLRRYLSFQLVFFNEKSIKNIISDKRIKHHLLFDKKIIDRSQKGMNIYANEIADCKKIVQDFMRKINY